MQEQDRTTDPSDRGVENETFSGESGSAAPEQGKGGNRDAEIMPSLEELLKAAELAAQEHHDAWLRAKAETENVRRRAQDDVAKAALFLMSDMSAGITGQTIYVDSGYSILGV